MASADLRQELVCSICRSIYTDPVTLRCGHNFCRACIDHMLDTHEEWTEDYSCPECRKTFRRRPALTRNITLCNIVGSVLSTQPDKVETATISTYCVDSPVPATKSCLLCEAHLCDNHLRVHSKTAEHVLSDPSTSLENRKCSIHKEIFRYYCTKEAACICVSCCLIGEHRGHQVWSLDEASEKKKEKLRDVLQKLTTKREETENKTQSLQERRRKIQVNAAVVTERVTSLFRDFKKTLEDLEKNILSKISRQAEYKSLFFSDLIQKLEIKKDKLSRKMHHIEELCNMSDPVTVLQEPDTGDLCDTEDTKRHDNQIHGVGNLNVGLISRSLQTLSEMITGINTVICVQEAADILLDVTTAGDNIQISGDRKTVSWSNKKQKHPVTPERFQCPQVISTRRFSSGKHYWEMDVSKSENWRVGMCCPSIDRRGNQSLFGDNDKSCCLMRSNNQYSVRHEGKVFWSCHNIHCTRVGIYLDYEAGLMSFFSICDHIRHLCTLNSDLTEPIHAALWLGSGDVNICGSIELYTSH